MEFTGALTGNRTIEVPAVAWPWVVYNNTSGAFSLTVKTNAGTGIVVPQGKRQVLYCDGTNVVDALSAISALDIAGNVNIGGTLGVTGNTTLTGTLTVNGTGTSSIAGLLDLSGASAGQIKFPATANPSSNANTLDDYEEGSWTITFSFATLGDLALSAETKEAYYLKIGSGVWVYWHYDFTPTFTTSASNAQLSTLPFTHRNVTNANCVGRGIIRHNGNITYPAGATMCYPSGVDNSTTLLIQSQGSATSAAALSNARFTSAVATSLHGSLFYQTDV
jgi:hypothetical protein